MKTLSDSLCSFKFVSGKTLILLLIASAALISTPSSAHAKKRWQCATTQGPGKELYYRRNASGSHAGDTEWPDICRFYLGQYLYKLPFNPNTPTTPILYGGSCDRWVGSHPAQCCKGDSSARYGEAPTGGRFCWYGE